MNSNIYLVYFNVDALRDVKCELREESTDTNHYSEAFPNRKGNDRSRANLEKGKLRLLLEDSKKVSQIT